MEIAEAQYGRRAERLPARFGNWLAICPRMSRWPRNGALARVEGRRGLPVRIDGPDVRRRRNPPPTRDSGSRPAVPSENPHREVERVFRRMKGFRRISSRYGKLDVRFIGFIALALVTIMLRSVNTP